MDEGSKDVLSEMAPLMTKLEAQGLQSYLDLVWDDFQRTFGRLGRFLQRPAFVAQWTSYNDRSGPEWAREHVDQFESVVNELGAMLFFQDPRHPVPWAAMERPLPVLL